jgi:hypothetical protein
MFYLAYVKYKKKIIYETGLWVLLGCSLIITFAWIFYFVKISGGGSFTLHHDWWNWKDYLKWVDINYFYKTMFYVPARHALTPLGYLFFIIGIATCFKKGFGMFYLWILGIYINFALDPYPSFQVLHEYYYYQLVPAASVFGAAGIMWLWDRRGKIIRYPAYGKIILSVVFVLLLLLSFNKVFYRYNTESRMEQYLPAAAVKKFTDKGSAFVYAGGSPQMVYYCDRRGWMTAEYPEYNKTKGYSAIERYRKKGAGYLVNLTSADFKEKQREYLEELRKNYKLVAEDENYLIYDLGNKGD